MLDQGVIDCHVFSQGTPSRPLSLLFHTYLFPQPRCHGIGSLLVHRLCSFLYFRVYEFPMFILNIHVLRYFRTCSLYTYLLQLLLPWNFQFVIYTRGEGLTYSTNKRCQEPHNILNVLQFGVRSSPPDLFHLTWHCSWGLGFRVCTESASCCSGCTHTSLHVYCPVNCSCVLNYVYS